MHADESARRFALAAARLSNEAARVMRHAEERSMPLRLEEALEAMEDLEVLSRVGGPLGDAYDDASRRLDRVTMQLAAIA